MRAKRSTTGLRPFEIPLLGMFKSINKVIKVLVLSDVVFLTGLGFSSPIFAIFIANNIQGGNVKIAGFAASIYCIVLALVLIPFGKYLDRNHGERDDLYFIMIGNFLIALAVFGYIFSSLIWHIYLLQVLYAVGIGMNIPGYTAIFTRHVDKGKEAFSWSARATFVGIGTGIAGALGGTIALYFGFKILFAGAGIFIILSSLLPLLILKDISPRDKKMPRILEIKTVKPPTPKL